MKILSINYIHFDIIHYHCISDFERPTMPVHHIDHYQFGKIVIDGVTYTRDVIILPAGVLPNWWRSEGHRLVSANLERILEAKPDFLVIGSEPGIDPFRGPDIPEPQVTFKIINIEY